MLKFKRLGYGDAIFLESDCAITVTNENHMTYEANDGTLFVSKTSDPTVFHYGLISNKEQYGHAPGYVWSSRVGCLNLVFGTDFVEVVIDNRAGFCMHSTDVLKLLPDGCSFEKQLKFEDNEPYYKLCGYNSIDWGASFDGIQMFNSTSEIVEKTDCEPVALDDNLSIMPTNYEGIFVFDTPTLLINRCDPITRNIAVRSKFRDASESIKSEYVEVYVNKRYGYCASRKYLVEKFPDKFKNKIFEI